MRVFLTGASGYLGDVLVEHFSRVPQIESVTATWHVAPPRRPLPKKVSFLRMDVRSPELSSAMAGHDVVVHTALVVLWHARMSAAERDDINFNGTRNVAQAAVANRVRRFVYSSSTAAYDVNRGRGHSGTTEDSPLGKGDSSSYYANSKAVIERMLTEIVAKAGITLTMFRAGFIIGPRNKATTRSLRGLSFKPLGRDPRLQYVHEEDVAAAFTQAVLSDMPGAYNLISDDYVRLSELQKIIGVKPKATIPVWLARLIAHLRWKYSGAKLHPSWLDLMLVDSTVSNAKLKATGWRPKYNTAEALKSALG